MKHATSFRSAGLLLGLACGQFISLSVAWAQPFDIMSFDPTSTGPWSDVSNTTLVVPKVTNGSIKLDADISSAEYGGFKPVSVTPGVNAWILDYPEDRVWDGPSDSSFTYYLAHDDTYLYVAVDVKDEIVTSDDEPGAFWKDDAIEIVADALNDRLDDNTDNSNDKYGGHCYVNYQGTFSRWDEAGGTINGQTWASAVEWTYGEKGDIFGFGKEVAGGWKMEVRFNKRLFQDPAATNKLANGYKMGFNIGLDDDDKHGPGLNGDGSRTQDLEIQYFWANRQRHIGLTASAWSQLTPEQQVDPAYLDSTYAPAIDSTGRLTHGGTGEIVFAAATSVPAKLTLVQTGGALQLSWTGTGTLEEADHVPGTWTQAANQSSPQTLTPSTGAKFYRVRQ